MATFKCKMCGGSIEVCDETTITCDYCGSLQTLPRLNDDKVSRLFERANHFRRNNDFDKASAIYEEILNESGDDAEVYWSLILCKYGIEYVEDPQTKRRIPTVNRAQLTSIFDDENYKSAIRYADLTQKTVFEAEAREINKIQKQILEISEKEEPYDVFICYKESDANGKRTHDSVYANELYHELREEGFKIFFSRITLEDKLGSAFEPYIFAALNSAKVMVVLGTKPEYFNAVWVKNEWSRFLSLIKSGKKKHLIPAYRDMDPYDLPEEFSHLQAQDMNKLGFMPDLIRGIKKLVGKDKAKDKPQASAPQKTEAQQSSAITPILKRVKIFLADKDWTNADSYCERALDLEPECAVAYLYKLMAQLKVSNEEQLSSLGKNLNSYPAYNNAFRFADEEFRSHLINIQDENEKIIEAELSKAEERRREEEYWEKERQARENEERARRQAQNEENERLRIKNEAKGSLIRARNNIQDKIRDAIINKNNLDAEINDLEKELRGEEGLKKYAIAALCTAIIFALSIILLIVSDGLEFWAVTLTLSFFGCIILTGIYIVKRDRSFISLGIMFLVVPFIITLPIYTIVVTVKHLKSGLSKIGIQANDRIAHLRQEIKTIENYINDYRSSLSTVNEKIERFPN